MADVTYIGNKKNTQGAPALPPGQASVVHCLMIPLTTDILLLPNAAIAEVIAARQPDVVEGTPNWFLGHVDWREYKVPVIAFETLNGDVEGEVAINKQGRIAIMNTLNGNTRLPYIGIMTQGIPRLQVVQAKGIEANTETVGRNNLYVNEFVVVNGEPISIPNLDLLERVLIELSP
ncbi:MAG: chemotaxis protein CheW [Gammaproteobacteria bacterium]|nr:chemotaxis protein CheW [Gammaproteobacteria bacterium]